MSFFRSFSFMLLLFMGFSFACWYAVENGQNQPLRKKISEMESELSKAKEHINECEVKLESMISMCRGVTIDVQQAKTSLVKQYPENSKPIASDLNSIIDELSFIVNNMEEAEQDENKTEKEATK